MLRRATMSEHLRARPAILTFNHTNVLDFFVNALYADTHCLVFGKRELARPRGMRQPAGERVARRRVPAAVRPASQKRSTKKTGCLAGWRGASRGGEGDFARDRCTERGWGEARLRRRRAPSPSAAEPRTTRGMAAPSAARPGGAESLPP